MRKSSSGKTVGDQLALHGVRENNLKNLSLEIPHDRLIVVTGVSGSGKSTLAFDTIYAEGGRRYIETFSPYTRQFLDRLHQPELDTISGVRPALALEQRNRTTSSRSTVGTITEINDYLKVVWPELAEMLCAECGEKVTADRPVTAAIEIVQHMKSILNGIVAVCFPVPLSSNVSSEALAATLESEGFLRFFDRDSGEIRLFEELDATNLPSELFVVCDRIRVPERLSSAEGKKLTDSVLSSLTQAFHFGKGEARVFLLHENRSIAEERHFSEELSCPKCRKSYPKLSPAHFSFNSPLGACPQCHGFGKVLEIDVRRCVPDTSKSIEEGAVSCWATKSTTSLFRALKKFCASNGIDVQTPWRALKESERQKILTGKPKERGYPGVYPWFENLLSKRHKMHVRVFLSRYRGEFTCPTCHGTRLRPDALNYKLDGKTLPELWHLPVSDLLPFIESLISTRAPRGVTHEIAEIALDEIRSRLQYMADIGLPYLTLDRQTKTLSGGESQRVNLTAILGSRLVNITLVLDEPTIGLHSRDTQRLIEVFERLRDRGNTLVVVEHDAAVIRSADEVVDLGPESGHRGGQIVYQGSVEGLWREKPSLTGQYLSGKLKIAENHQPNRPVVLAPRLTLRGARAHNLKSIDVEIPLGVLVTVTGVSGSGKSSLIRECLVAAAESPDLEGVPLEALEGRENIDEVVFIDQTPVGKTPRSNPGTYTGAWDLVRDLLAETDEAKRLGLGRSAFSFNVEGGRCPECDGAGYHRIEMQFLADVFVECEACQGTRFKEEVLSVRYGGKNVRELLNMSLDEIYEFLAGRGEEAGRISKLRSLIAPMLDLGLGYLRIGQPLSDLSGGEAQRIKLASYLSESSRKSCLFLFDEPTTGLHPKNVSSLLKVFRTLIDRGHSVLCIEHNTDLIAASDWMIDLGPEGGAGGGTVVVEGPPQQLLRDKEACARSYTLKALLDETSVAPPSKARASVLPVKRSNEVTIVGARHHNLKNVSVSFPHQKLTVVTGVSGSGKSTLAFDILFQEGQRRYIDSLSPYARQYLTQVARADVDRVDSLPPTIAISQKTAPPHGVSTIATVTEVYQFLRLLFCKVGEQFCPDHDLPITGLTPEAITEQILREFRQKRISVFAPVVSGRKGFYNELFDRALRAEITEARIDGKIQRIVPDMRLERHKLHWISLLVGTLNCNDANRELLEGAVRQALLLGSGTVEILPNTKGAEPMILSTERVCPKCHRGFRELDPQDFSFRSQRGVCTHCEGRGKLETTVKGKRKAVVCPTCEGARIGPVGRHVYIGGKRISDFTALTSRDCLRILRQVKFPERLNPVVRPILREVERRLEVIIDVGLDYLALDRDASTISGGEAQRLRLARALGSPMSGVCYVLDEPTIGLHPRDHDHLMKLLFELRDLGNTVVVVEHDEETIVQADHIVDIGPVGGSGGGHVVVAGSVDDVIRSEASVTGLELRRRLAVCEKPQQGRTSNSTKSGTKFLEITGATANNLKSVSAKFPIGQLTVVCGVSGAGKSSLVHGTLFQALVAEIEGGSDEIQTWRTLKNAEGIDRLIEIDQSPVGKTSASTPASYLGIFDAIRKVYALIPEAKSRGWGASHFSFNSGKGRCGVCSGKGFVQVPMSFLPNATALCEQCNGLRYDAQTLDILYQGLSLGELLQKTMSEAKEILANHSAIRRVLSVVDALGIGYLTLGQPTHTLSGGEIQRLKIAREIGSREAVNTLYVLDEPTIGLHMADVGKLRNVLAELIERGNTVVMIEHNLDIIRSADYLIELGPEAGDRGGQVIFQGTPQELLSSAGTTPTREVLLRGPMALRSRRRKSRRSSPVELAVQ